MPVTREDQHIEWKESWRDEYLRWLCGFANAEGGVLVIGRNDRGEAVGVKNTDRLLEELPNKIRDVLGIVAGVRLVQEGGKDLVEVHVEAYPSPISYKGEYHLRSGSTKQELKGAALDRFLLRKQGRSWDAVPVPHVAVGGLSGEAIARFRKLAARSQRLDAATLQEPDAALVEKLNLLEGQYLKRAAILLFHATPQRWFIGASVKLGYFRSDTDLVYHDQIEGDLFTQAHKTVELLLGKYLKAVISYEGLQRVETWPVPEAALREALLNALIHRDYAVGAPIQIRVHDDLLRIWNPGELPEHWSLERLLQAHPSRPFNPTIANAFFRAGEIEAWGRGIQRIFDACRQAGTPPPQLEYTEGDWSMAFPFSPAYLVALRGDTAQVPHEVTGEVTGEVERLILALDGSMKRAQIQQALGLKHEDHFRDAYLQPALAAGLIAMTVPDKPRSSRQQYRLTQRGQILRADLLAKRPA